MMPTMTHEELERAIARRPRTVRDARQLLRPALNQLIRVEIDDGDLGKSHFYGVLRDVVRDEHKRFHLLLQGLLPTDLPEVRSRHRERHEIVRVPLTMVRRLPPGLSFLLDPPEEWPMPEPSIVCPSCQAGSEGKGVNPGRFCVRCGKRIRSGPSLRFPGEGFLVIQKILHEAHPGSACPSCGGGLAPQHAYCMKCGTSVERSP